MEHRLLIQWSLQFCISQNFYCIRFANLPKSTSCFFCAAVHTAQEITGFIMKDILEQLEDRRVMTGFSFEDLGDYMADSVMQGLQAGVNEAALGDYATGYVGKWHLGDEIFAQHGFDEWYGVEDDYQRFFTPGRSQDERSPYHHWLVERGYRPPAHNHFPRDWCCQLPERDSKPAFCAERAVDFIQRHSGDGNWVLSVNTLEPHHPLITPLTNGMFHLHKIE